MTYDIYINAAIGWPISYEYVRSELKKCEGRPANVYVSSLGGSLVEAMKIRQLFVDHGQVTCHLHGFVASAATILSTGAARVLMGRHALYLAHRCSNWVDTWGQMNAEELSRAIEELKAGQLELEKIDRTVAGVYAARAGRSAEEFFDLMKQAQWLSAEEVLGLGLADGLAEDDSAAAADPASDPAASSAAFAARFAACGLPLPPTSAPATAPAASAPAAAPAASATETTETPNTTMPTNTTPDNAPEAKKPSALSAFFERLASKLDALFGLDNLDDNDSEAPAAPAAEAPAAPAAEAPAEPAAPAAPAAEAPAEPSAPAAEAPATATEAEAAERIKALTDECAALRAQIEAMKKQDGATSDPVAAAPAEFDGNAEAERINRLRAASRRYR